MILSQRVVKPTVGSSERLSDPTKVRFLVLVKGTAVFGATDVELYEPLPAVPSVPEKRPRPRPLAEGEEDG